MTKYRHVTILWVEHEEDEGFNYTNEDIVQAFKDECWICGITRKGVRPVVECQTDQDVAFPPQLQK